MDRTVNRPSSVTSRPNTTINNNRPTGNFNNRPSGNSNIGNHGGSNNGGNRPSTGGRSNFGRDNARSSVGTPAASGGVINNARPTDQYNRGNSRPSGNGNDRPGGNGRPGNDRPGGNMGGGNHGSNDRPGGNMGGGNHGGNNRPGGFDRPDNNRPGNRPGGYGRPDNDRRYHGDRPGGGYHGNRPGGRPSMAVGGYFNNLYWNHNAYRSAGLSAVLGYQFNEHWEAYLYGQKSITENRFTPYPLYDLGNLGDRIGAAVRYNVNPSFSVEMSVEHGSWPRRESMHDTYMQMPRGRQ